VAAARTERLIPARARLGGLVNRPALLVVPLVVFLVAFFVYPALTILLRSVTDFNTPEVGGLDNYRWFFDTSANLVVLRRTLVTALAITAICVLVGYPYAYLMTLVGPRLRAAMLGLVVIAGFTSFMVRNYAWLIILQDNGPLNDLIDAAGLPRAEFIGHMSGVLIAFTQILLPLMILPMYATMRGIDRRLMMASSSLGATPASRFRSIYLPLSMPGVIAGSLLVFVVTLGFYVTPALIGSPTNALFSQLMQIQVGQLLAWGHVGAMAVILTVVTLGLLAACALLARRWRVPEQEGGSLGLLHEPGSLFTPGRAALAVVSALTALLLVAPMLIVIPQSFAGEQSIAFPPESWSTRWYENLFSDPSWSDSLIRSIGVGIAATLLSLVLGCMAALGMVRGRFPGKTVVSGLVAMPLILPLVIFAVGVYAVFLRWRLIGSFEGFVVAHTALAVPYVVVVVGAALRSFDPRLEDAAASLGASRVRALWSVTLPVLMPSILTGALFAFLTSFDEVLASVFISSPTVTTLPAQMYRSVLRGADPTIAAAASVILVSTLILMIATLQTRRFARDAG
jgi:putative spermidine/putrescine transport system permease protein